MPNGLLDFFGGNNGQQPGYGGGGFGGMSNSLIGLGMGLLTPYNAWKGESPWSNALQGYQTGAVVDQRRQQQQQELQMQRERMAQAKALADREPESIRQLRAAGVPQEKWADYLYPKAQPDLKQGSVTYREQEYPYQFNPRDGSYTWGPMGPPPNLAQQQRAAAPPPVVPGTTLYWPGQQQSATTADAAPATTGAGGTASPAPDVLPPKPAGYDTWLPSEQKAWNTENIKLGAKRAAAEPEQKAQALESASVAMRELDAAIKQSEAYPAMVAGPFGNMMKGVPGSQATDVSKRLEVVKANIAFDKLQAMRRSSPTGGALGNVSDKDMALLQNSLASLDQAQTPEQFIAAMKNVRTHYANVVAKIQGSGGQSAAPAARGGGGDPLRIR